MELHELSQPAASNASPDPAAASVVAAQAAPAHERRRRTPVWASCLWLLTSASLVALLLAYLLPPAFERTEAWYVALATSAFMLRVFQFHLGLALLLVLLLAALGRRWRLVAVSAAGAALALWPDLSTCVPHDPPATAGRPITIMSVNLLASNRRGDAILEQIHRADPDVICLQEYSSYWHQTLGAALGDTYPHVARVVRDDSFGIAVYSRVPFEPGHCSTFQLGGGRTPQQRVVLRWNGRETVLYNVHLTPPMSLRWARRQRLELADLRDRLAAERGPLIVCGDFNATNCTPHIAAIEELGLIDVHLLAGRGRGSTWPALGLKRYLPGLRLDHILVSPALAGLESRVGTEFGSDHRPLVARVAPAGAPTARQRRAPGPRRASLNPTTRRNAP